MNYLNYQFAKLAGSEHDSGDSDDEGDGPSNRDKKKRRKGNQARVETPKDKGKSDRKSGKRGAENGGVPQASGSAKKGRRDTDAAVLSSDHDEGGPTASKKIDAKFFQSVRKVSHNLLSKVSSVT